MKDFGSNFYIYVLLSFLLCSCDIFRSGYLLLDDNSTCKSYITDVGTVEVYAKGNLSRANLQTVSYIQILLNGNFYCNLDSLQYMFEGNDSVYSVACHNNSGDSVAICPEVDESHLVNLRSDTIIGGQYPFFSIHLPDIYEKSKMLYILPSNKITNKNIPVLTDTIKVMLRRDKSGKKKNLRYTVEYSDLKFDQGVKPVLPEAFSIEGVYCLSKEDEDKQWCWAFYEDGSCALLCLTKDESNVISCNPGIYRVSGDTINVNLYSGRSDKGYFGNQWRFARLKFKINNMKSLTLMNRCHGDTLCLDYSLKPCPYIITPTCVEDLKKMKWMQKRKHH